MVFSGKDVRKIRNSIRIRRHPTDSYKHSYDDFGAFHYYINDEKNNAELEILHPHNFSIKKTKQGFEVVDSQPLAEDAIRTITWKIGNQKKIKVSKVSVTLNTAECDAKWFLITEQFKAELETMEENVIDLDFCSESIDLILEIPKHVTKLQLLQEQILEINIHEEKKQDTTENNDDNMLILAIDETRNFLSNNSYADICSLVNSITKQMVNQYNCYYQKVLVIRFAGSKSHALFSYGLRENEGHTLYKFHPEKDNIGPEFQISFKLIL